MKAQQTLKHIPSMLIPLFESGTVYFCATRDDWQKAHQALDADAGMLDRRGCANTNTDIRVDNTDMIGLEVVALPAGGAQGEFDIETRLHNSQPVRPPAVLHCC